MDLPAGARFVLERLTGAGFAAYVVGGCVRDAMRGDAPKDYDVCTSALPEETKRVFFRLPHGGHGPCARHGDGNRARRAL